MRHTGASRKSLNASSRETLGQIDSVVQFLHHSWQLLFLEGTHIITFIVHNYE